MSQVRFATPEAAIACYLTIIDAARRMRPQVEAMRVEHAQANDLSGLLAIASVTDQVDEWEFGYARKVRQVCRKHRLPFPRQVLA